MPKTYGQVCPVARTLEVVGERWTLLLVRDLLRGPRRFQDFQDSLAGIAPNVLSDRLKLLEEHGIVERHFYSQHPPRAEYLLTEKGRDLGIVVGALASWGSRHSEAASRVVHAECGHAVEMAYHCPSCETRLDRDAVRLERPSAEPGVSSSEPGASA